MSISRLVRAFYFYPRSPCGERLGTLRTVSVRKTFLSTLSLRRATAAFCQAVPPKLYFYPRSPCGERRRESDTEERSQGISIHALLAESDRVDKIPYQRQIYHFYPRSPCGERLTSGCLHVLVFTISIHALLAESDCSEGSGFCRPRYFYPRSPCGERLFEYIQAGTGILFLSTLSLRRATRDIAHSEREKNISIHALLAESDGGVLSSCSAKIIFLSTLSLRRATHYDNYNLHCVEISIHALLAESDPFRYAGDCTATHFYPRSPCGERPWTAPNHLLRRFQFLSTLSLRRAT